LQAIVTWFTGCAAARCIALLCNRCAVCVLRAVTRAVNGLVAPDKLTSDAVDVRQELDLRIGVFMFCLTTFII